MKGELVSTDDANKNYPEHMKLRSVKDNSNVIGDFLVWLDSKHLHICFYDKQTERFQETHKRIEQLLADYFEIDNDKLEKEKRMMLKEIRDKNGTDTTKK